MKTGVGYRRELAEWIDSQPSGVECLEITAEHFFGGGGEVLARLAGRHTLFVHGLGLSLGTPGPLDSSRLDKFAEVVRAANPEWISEHVAFTRSGETDLGHLNPLPATRETLGIVADHAREVAARCGKPILLENITSHLRLAGEMEETEFLNRLCDRAGCGLLLDVTNLFINSRNHGFDPLAWLGRIEPGRVRQLHIVGYSRENGRYTDSHAEPIQEELIELARAVAGHTAVEAVILERDGNFPSPGELDGEMSKVRRIRVRH